MFRRNVTVAHAGSVVHSGVSALNQCWILPTYSFGSCCIAFTEYPWKFHLSISITQLERRWLLSVRGSHGSRRVMQTTAPARKDL
jgi:hypothetical protein